MILASVEVLVLRKIFKLLYCFSLSLFVTFIQHISVKDGEQMKISAKTMDCRLLVKVKASFRESFDVKALDSFARTYLRGFLKPKLLKKKLIEYSGPVGISLYDR